MMTKIVNLARKHFIFRIVISFGAWISLNLLSFIWEVGSLFRKIGVPSSRYNKIKELEGIHDNERCFVICTGPSLTIEDLELLKHETTFAMNSIPLLFDKTDFRPTYYGVIDEGVFLKLNTEIRNFSKDCKMIFISNRCTKHGNVMDNWREIPVNVAYHTYDRWFKGKFWAKFSDNAYAGLYDMYSVTHFLIQIAVYMGFKEIYLIGADCNQRPGRQIHFAEYGVPDASIDTARERNICGYKVIKEYCDNHNVKVFNSTRGGELEVFERKSIDQVIGKTGMA